MDFLKAVIIGGLICAVGQVLMDTTKLTPARILVSFVIAGVALGALGLYKPLVEWAGAGATVPLTGFGYTLAKGTKQAVESDGLLAAAGHTQHGLRPTLTQHRAVCAGDHAAVGIDDAEGTVGNIF